MSFAFVGTRLSRGELEHNSGMSLFGNSLRENREPGAGRRKKKERKRRRLVKKCSVTPVSSSVPLSRLHLFVIHSQSPSATFSKRCAFSFFNVEFAIGTLLLIPSFYGRMEGSPRCLGYGTTTVGCCQTKPTQTHTHTQKKLATNAYLTLHCRDREK